MSDGPVKADFGAARGGFVAGSADDETPFVEETYLRFNPDVRIAVAAGAFRSGRDHYERYGRAEGRPYKTPDPQSRNRIVVTADAVAARESAKLQLCAVDSVQLSPGGGLYLRGWADDAADPLDSVDVYFAGWSVSFDATALARVRREDAEAALGGGRHEYGFWVFMAGAAALAGGQCSVVVRLSSGAEMGVVVQAEPVGDQEMRTAVLETLAGAACFGQRDFAVAGGIGGFIGAQFGQFNKLAAASALAAPYAERYGNARRYRGTLIVVLRGEPQAMSLQMARLARQKGMQDYEMIHVCNDPAAGEAMLREARLCRMVYGLDHTLLLLNGDAGYAGACNLAAQLAASDRLLLLDAAALPRPADWLTRHGQLLAGRPAAETALCGAPVYGGDGALINAGMGFKSDTMPAMNARSTQRVTLLREERYGSGVPLDTAMLTPRPVPAVSGICMSVAKPWFEKLAGFSPEYADGPFQDADFCLRSSRAGVAPWLQDMPVWRLREDAAGETQRGGAIFNRWLFTSSWAEALGRPTTEARADARPGAPVGRAAARARKS